MFLGTDICPSVSWSAYYTIFSYSYVPKTQSATSIGKYHKKTPWQIPIMPHSGTDNLNHMLNYHGRIFIWIRLVYFTPQSYFCHMNHHYLYFDQNSNFTKLPLQLLHEHEDWSRYNKILHIRTQATSRKYTWRFSPYKACIKDDIFKCSGICMYSSEHVRVWYWYEGDYK